MHKQPVLLPQVVVLFLQQQVTHNLEEAQDITGQVRAAIYQELLHLLLVLQILLQMLLILQTKQDLK